MCQMSRNDSCTNYALLLTAYANGRQRHYSLFCHANADPVFSLYSSTVFRQNWASLVSKWTSFGAILWTAFLPYCGKGRQIKDRRELFCTHTYKKSEEEMFIFSSAMQILFS